MYESCWTEFHCNAAAAAKASCLKTKLPHNTLSGEDQTLSAGRWNSSALKFHSPFFANGLSVYRAASCTGVLACLLYFLCLAAA